MMPDKVIAVVPAAGRGRRMGAGLPKQFLMLAGRPVLSHCLQTLERVEAVQEVIVVGPGEELGELRGLCIEPYGLSKVREVVPGGDQRQDSVAAGVERALARGAAWILVHDGVRPLAPAALFSRVLEAARQTGAAAAAMPCVDTVKRAGEDRLVEATLDRSRLWLIQTPQVFRADLLAQALEAAAEAGFYATDEAGLIEWQGGRVKLVEGSGMNLKVTTPEDLRLARAWLGGEAPALRVGQGMDVHALVPGRRLVLAGVEIDHELGLAGHSDADLLTHALMDALLAAAGLGDIGGMFPDSDPAFKDAASLELLDQVVGRLARHGWRPAQASLTLAAQRPRIAPLVPEMRRNLARVLGLEDALVNLAATTTEGLGFVGRGEGMAAWATAVIAPLPGD